MRAALLGGLALAAAGEGPPAFPLQFVATIETTAHLIAEDVAYPPRLKRVRLAYDYVNRRARADVLAGLDAGKNFTRRYDQKQDYVVRGGGFPGCQRSHLGERMPRPEIPAGAVKQPAGALIDDAPPDDPPPGRQVNRKMSPKSVCSPARSSFTCSLPSLMSKSSSTCTPRTPIP